MIEKQRKIRSVTMTDDGIVVIEATGSPPIAMVATLDKLVSLMSNESWNALVKQRESMYFRQLMVYLHAGC